jgi:alkylated DNA nucleotide flippase Atl1/3-methyladenine DNA glycosylase AlkD
LKRRNDRSESIRRRIGAVVARIPPGKVATYGQVALLAGLGRGARQVGRALALLPEGANIPWQRVINSRGEVSPRGAGWEEGYQRHLLEEEGVPFDARGRVDLARYGWDPDTKPRNRSLGTGNNLSPSRSSPSPSPGRDASRLVVELERALRRRGTAERARGEKRYLKSELEFLGVDAAGLRATAREFLGRHPGLSDAELRRLVGALWDTDVHELRSAGLALLERRPDALRPADLARLERLLRRAGTWAHVDWIAVHFVGPLIERHPRLATRLDRWARDPDFWLRRSALLALLLPLRRGAGDWERLVRYADAMLGEREFFIRKAIGWVLRESAKRRPERVRAYVAARLPRLSGLTLREAIRPLPEGERRLLLERYRAFQSSARRSSRPQPRR